MSDDLNKDNVQDAQEYMAQNPDTPATVTVGFLQGLITMLTQMELRLRTLEQSQKDGKGNNGINLHRLADALKKP